MKYLYFLFFVFISFYLSAQNTTCSAIDPFCTADGVDFPSNTNSGNAEVGPNYGCLGTDTPNPSWFYLKIDEPGDLFMLIEQNSAADFTGTGLDVDFVAWGPFTEAEYLAGICGDLTGGNIVPGDGTSGTSNTTTTQGCSYSGNAVENFNIIGANAGDYFVLLITNWGNAPGFIRMNQTNTKGGSTDCSILDSTLGPDQNVCEGDTVVLDATPTAGTAISYNWSLDTGAGFNNFTPTQTGATLTIDGTTGVAKVTGTYRVELVDINGVTETDEAVITFSTTPIANNTTKIEQCDDDNNSLWSFDLTTRNTDIIGAQDATQFTISYYTNQSDADTDTDPITSPATYINTSNPQTIYARIANNGNVDCYNTTNFEIEVYDTPIANPVTNLHECDDNNDDSWDFNLDSQSGTILGTQDTTQFTITYHTSLVDADADANPITTSTSYTNLSNPQTIFVRIDNNDNNDCYNTTSFEIEVFDTPTANIVTKIDECDDNNDGFFDFDLTTKNTDILGAQDATQFTITYHTSIADADADTNPIATPSAYTNTSSPQTIFVRIDNNDNNNCYDTTDFEIEVYKSAFPSTTIALLGSCDDTSVGSDFDGFIIFDLTQRETEILNGQSTADFTLTYFTDAGYTTQIPVGDIANFTNTVAGGQTIYVRMTNNLNANCYSDTSFEIEVFPLPVLNTSPGIPPYELIQCDDPSNDAEANFNLNQANGDVINPVTTETFIYYTSEALAIAGVPGTEIPDATAYFVTGSVDQVWVRVVTVNGCFRTAMVNLIIRPSQINPDYQLYECDDFLDIDGNDTPTNNDTDGITTFDFQDEIDLILAPFAGTAGVSVSCHHTEADSDAGINPIDPTTYSNYRNKTSANQERIWVRIVSTLGNDCLANGNFITLNANQVPIANTVADLKLCDNDDDGDNTNGIGVLFDLESQTNLIRETGTVATDFPITYHLSKADADTGNSPQSSPFSNTTNGQTIYARIVNTATGCVNAHIEFSLIVNSLPIIDFTNISLASECDNDDDGDDTNEIGVTFDLGSLRDDFKNLQPDIATVNYIVTYHENLTDAQASPGLNPLSDLYPNIINNQTIFVRIENDNTGCIRIEESPIFLVVNPLPILTPITIAPACDNDEDGDDTNGSVTWNLDDYIGDFTSMQTTTDPVTVTFHTTLSGASSTPFTDEITTTSAYLNTSNPEQIFVRVTNNITGCFRAIHAFDLIVNPLPEFELADESLVCENILPHEISVENPTESDYLYEWFNSNGVSIGNDQTLIITDTNDITVAGVYYLVTATNPTTFCERTKSIRVWKSSIATITDADIITVEFSSPENSIEVLTANLGSGDYEFALEHPRDSRYYQDDPKFVDLMGGIYTLLVRDKNGCGETSIEVVLIDYPRFLTPNNDSYNDTWQLLGVESAKFTVSPIEIYDRYGKLVTIINATDIGWDGTYNGAALPSGGFWFALTLTDQLGKTTLHRGNFSLVRR